MNEKSVRSTLQETYERSINDLKTASQLLPSIPIHVMRPSKAAAYAALARVYLSMGNYDSSLAYSNKCLQINTPSFNSLFNYSTRPTASTTPFLRFNSETIFYCTMPNIAIFIPGRLNIDNALIATYNADDLRPALFFRSLSGVVSFKGSYDQSNTFYCGLTTDEVYLTKAECQVRKGDVQEGLNTLNALIKTRWKSTVVYPPITATNGDDALTKVLLERRKQLLFRGVRWSDLRRLNKDPRFAKTLTRNLNGTIYTLPPNDLKYTLPIPDDEVMLSGLQQNPRQ